MVEQISDDIIIKKVSIVRVFIPAVSKKRPETKEKAMSDVTRRRFLGAAAGGTALAVLKPSALFAAQKEFELLPPPSTSDNDGSLMTALKNRKSTRSFSNEPLPQQLLSDLLWAAFGVNRPDIGYRTAPSPMSSQEIEIYVAEAKGLYLYDARFHQLVQLSTEDIRSLCGTQGYVAHAPLNLIYVANFSKFGDMEDEKKKFLTAADTGFISQNVYLFCAAFGLGTVVRDWIDRPTLAKKIRLVAFLALIAIRAGARQAAARYRVWETPHRDRPCPPGSHLACAHKGDPSW